ncbi:hypothetical protein NP493_292g01022 [Ridgeia piscesae]|uniref:Uncharacterized protein n=1 Tax=Ridgeia piscesae TaxID=27915 RepID=A0AAD9UC66_RIDPI|nr:hypothetical protein NP493_292g01022 [Ridgeia piscesae]
MSFRCGSGYVGVYCGVTKRTTNNKTGIALGVVIALILVVAIAIGGLFLYRRRKERPCKTHSTTPSQDDNKITRRSETDMTDTHLEMTNIKDDTRDAAAVSSANIVVSETPNHNN